MFAAIVYKFHEDSFPKSHRPEGGYEAFLSNDKEEAVQMAITAAQRWENQPKITQGYNNPATGVYTPGTTKYYGPYQILVGELDQEAKRIQFKLVAVE